MLSLKTNLRDVIGWTQRLHSEQIPFATAVALTETVRDVQSAMPSAVEQAFEGGAVEFTKRGFYITPARKDRLTAVVGAKAKQAEYIYHQVEGGGRAPKNVALRLPSAVDLTAQGNIPAGLIRQLVARAKAGRRATKAQASRFGVSQKASLFYGEPGDGRPAGIYKRVELSTTRHQLLPIVVFPKKTAQYRKRFDFYGISTRISERRFAINFDRAFDRAVATAR
jgi:hypothetical protein